MTKILPKDGEMIEALVYKNRTLTRVRARVQSKGAPSNPTVNEWIIVVDGKRIRVCYIKTLDAFCETD